MWIVRSQLATVDFTGPGPNFFSFEAKSRDTQETTCNWGQAVRFFNYRGLCEPIESLFATISLNGGDGTSGMVYDFVVVTMKAEIAVVVLRTATGDVIVVTRLELGDLYTSSKVSGLKGCSGTSTGDLSW